MQAALFDTSVYVSALRRGDTGMLAIRRLSTGSIIWLSAVVLEELYAGTNDGNRYVVKRLDRDFDRADRILVPNQSDWSQAGTTLARLADEYGYDAIGQGRLTNAALIGTAAGRKGIKVITTNARDFARLAEFRPFRWEIAVI